MRRLAALAAVLAGLLGLTAVAAPAASAACSGPTVIGAPLPASAGQEPLITRLGLRRVWEISTGAGVAVAVVDSGVDGRHPKLAGAVQPSTDFRGEFVGGRLDVASPGTGEDCENHGTPIAGIIAARPAGDDRVVGVAPDATIVPIRFEGDVGQATENMIAAAIRAGADRSRVLNLSFAVPVDNPAIAEAIRYALDRDVVVVAAAGNENESQPGFDWFPAAYPGVLAVAGLDANGQPSNASNRGPWVGIAAPGEGITAPSAGGDGYTVVEGTSFATAVVSGVAALVRSRYPDLSGAAVVERLRSTAVSLTGGQDERTGAGVVDPYQALTAVDVAPPPAQVPDAVGETVPVLPVPAEPDLLGPAGRIATATTGILLAVAGVVVLAGATARRVATRRGGSGRGRVDRYAPAHRPLEPVPDDLLT